MERKLTAILASDMVGYSRLIRTDEEGTIAALRALRSDLIDPRIAEHNGRVVKLMGDGMLVEFSSVVDATKAAVKIQQAMAARNADQPDDKRIEFRVGINIGDVVIDGDDIQGDGVNVAARLEGIAEPGGVCVSESVHDQVRDRTNFVFESLGPKELKNIARPVNVWRWVSDQSSCVAGASVSNRSQPISGKPSIAVLPFENMSSDPDQEFFADGMTEDVLTLLATVPDLIVIARNSTFAHKYQSPDVGKVAEELGVRYVLEGSVRKAGNRIRVSAQFIDAITGNHIWAERFDRDLQDIFAVQDEVAQGIVGALHSQLLVAESAYMSRKPASNLDAWGNVIQARIKTFAYRQEDIDAAEPFARKALEIEPDYAPALALLSQILAWRSYNGWTDDYLSLARESFTAAKRAMAIDATNPSVMADAAFAHCWLGLFLKSAPIAERAVELNPNSALICAVCGHALAIVGRTDEGVELCRKSFILSPKDPLEYMFHMHEGQSLYFAGNMTAAKRALEHSLRQKPDLVLSRLFMAAILAKEGQTEIARHELDRIIQSGSEFAIINSFRGRTSGTLWREFTEPIREIYDGTLPDQPD